MPAAIAAPGKPGTTDSNAGVEILVCRGCGRFERMRIRDANRCPAHDAARQQGREREFCPRPLEHPLPLSARQVGRDLAGSPCTAPARPPQAIHGGLRRAGRKCQARGWINSAALGGEQCGDQGLAYELAVAFRWPSAADDEQVVEFG